MPIVHQCAVCKGNGYIWQGRSKRPCPRMGCIAAADYRLYISSGAEARQKLKTDNSRRALATCAGLYRKGEIGLANLELAVHSAHAAGIDRLTIRDVSTLSLHEVGQILRDQETLF